MKIGIIVAMGKELRLLLNLIENKKEEENNGYKIYSGKIGTHDIFAMQCGIGKVNAAIGTLTLINEYAPELVINTGVAGGIDASTRVYDIIAGKEIVYHDVWCGEGNEPGQIQGLPPRFYSDPDLLKKAISLITSDRIYSGLICSGDRFITNREEQNKIKAVFPEGLAVDMESASIAQVCYMNQIPFLSFRIISDTPAAENHSAQYKRFWKDFPQKSFEIIKKLIDTL